MKLLLTVVVLLSIVAATAFAVMPIPTQLSYQGRLTSTTGTPITGTKNLTFRIYDGPGALRWNSGVIAVTCTDGLFSVILGGTGMPPITPDILNDPTATLGIQIESDPELSPRTPMASSAFSYTALIAPLYLPLGGGTLTGAVTWDFPDHDVQIQNGAGTSMLNLMGPLSAAVQLASNGDGTLALRNASSALNVMAYASSTFGGSLEIDNAAGTLTHLFSASDVGNSACVVPDNSISAREILDEPGIVSNTDSTTIALTTTMQDLVTVTITIPADGYIHLTGKVSEVDMWGWTSANVAFFQIDETAGGWVNAPYFSICGAEMFATTGYSFYTPIAERTYFKPAGTYTFRLEAGKSAPDPAMVNASYSILTATYFPTSYGAVETVVSDGNNSHLQRTAASLPSGVALSGAYKVDLRDLELKAAKARAEADKAELNLLQAKLHQQSLTETNR